MLGLAVSIDPLFYKPPMASHPTLGVQLRLWAPFVAPFIGAASGKFILRGARAAAIAIPGAFALLGLIVGLMSRPWGLWAGTSHMARGNTAWVTSIVFVAALLGSLWRWPRPGPQVTAGRNARG